MARVIKHGNSYEKLWKATYPRCKCFFEYGESDYLPVYPVLQREAMEHNIYMLSVPNVDIPLRQEKIIHI